MKRLVLLLSVLVLLALAACSGVAVVPEATLAPTAVIPTVAVATAAPPAPTDEPEPTATDQPTAAPTVEPVATDEPSPEPTATEEPSPEPTATNEPTPEPTEALPAAETAEIAIVDFAFAPENITVPVGSTVSWTHTGRAPHTATADNGTFDSGSLSNGGTFDFTFAAAGTYAYYCKIHGGPGQSGMSAVITVTD